MVQGCAYSSVLESIPVHLLSVVGPPKFILYELHKIFNRFLWNNKEKGKSKHWVAWDKMCYPKEEKGLGFRSLFDISKAMYSKLWQIFRATRSICTNYMRNKYCKKIIPIVVQWKACSQIWKKMLEARDSMEQEIWWEPIVGSYSIS